jgi:hypothetical protein
MRFVLILCLLLPQIAAAADGILPATPFKVPFAVDGKVVVNRAVIVLAADGKAVLQVHYVKADGIEEVSYLLTRQDGPGPNPGPEPKPDPKPDPVPPPVPIPTEIWAVVVEESSQRTPEQAILLASPKVRDLFAKDHFRIVDKDTAVNPDLKPYLDRSTSKTLPLLYVVDGKGSVFYEGPLPATIQAAEELVAKIKKGAK